MAITQMRSESYIARLGDSNENAVTPEWLKSPASIVPIESIDDFTYRADAFFAQCTKDEIRPTITGLCLAVGLPGPTSLIRLGQRIPELRYPISCCMTAIAYGYERLIGAGSSTGAMFMLKNIPDFDPEESAGSPGVQFFNDRKEILLQTVVEGAVTKGDSYANDEDPLEVYLSIVQNATTVIGDKKDKSGDVFKKDKVPANVRAAKTQLFRIIGGLDD